MRRSAFCCEELETNAEKEKKEKEEKEKEMPTALDARSSCSCEGAARTTRAEVRHEGIARHGAARVAA